MKSRERAQFLAEYRDAALCNLTLDHLASDYNDNARWHRRMRKLGTLFGLKAAMDEIDETVRANLKPEHRGYIQRRKYDHASSEE